MKHLLFPVFLMAASPLVAQTCPMGPDLTERRSALMEAVKIAPDERSARVISNDLWKIWATAPDKAAQELLDEGMQRREAFDFDAAIVAFDALINYCPDYAEGYNQRAFVLFLKQDFEPALVDLDRAIERRPDHIAALAGRALTLMGLGRDDEAQVQLRDALKLNPWLSERRFLTGDPPEIERDI